MSGDRSTSGDTVEREDHALVRLLAIMMLYVFLGPGFAYCQCHPDTSLHSGEATYYTFADGTGNCMYDATPSDLMLGAMNDPDYGNSEVCGECVELTGPDGTIKIRIVDRCPECLSGDIDLSPEAFSLIAPLSRGRVPINWHLIPCEVTGPIEYHFKDGSNQWWTAVQIRNHRHPVASLEYMTGAGTFKSVNRVDYNYFVETGGMGPGPYTFRVTDIYGHVLIDNGITHIENGSVAGQAQFPPCENTTSIPIRGEVPSAFWLSQNYPNPWNPQTTIRYGLPRAEFVSLTVYDAVGRQAAQLVNGHQHAGSHEAVLQGDGLASGVYYYTLRAGDFQQTRKLILVR
ncbi:MAG TPA: expansin EXLX1 family cellulose-binding protein [Bacteroidota bacterium]|nr:expansin EXLX1 family cellulose-binding protein [Bacteroidota bacterium]